MVRYSLWFDSGYLSLNPSEQLAFGLNTGRPKGYTFGYGTCLQTPRRRQAQGNAAIAVRRRVAAH